MAIRERSTVLMDQESILELDLRSLVGTAAQKHQLGQLQEAESIYRGLISHQPSPGGVPGGLEDIYHLVLLDFGVVLGRQGKLAEAVEQYQQALTIKPDFVRAHFFLARAFTQQGKFAAALELYEQALTLKPDFTQARFYLAILLQEQGKLEEAVESYQQVLQLNPEFTEAYFGLANLLKKQGKFTEAIEHYQQVLKLKPGFVEAYNNLGNIFKQQGNFNEAIRYYQQAVTLKPDFFEAFHNLGNLFKEKGKLEQAIQFYQQSLQLKPDCWQAYESLGSTFRRQGKVEEAVQSYQKALQLSPTSTQAEFGICISQLPIIYTHVEEIQLRRDRYDHALQSFANRYQNSTPKQQAQAASAVGTLQPFFLAYQGLNDRPLQQIYGKLIHQFMSCRYPEYSQPISGIKLAENEKIRVGFVSGFFRSHSNWKIPIKGWVENLDRQKFELFGYHTGVKQDQYTEEATQAFSQFIQGPLMLKQWCETIQGDRLHVLIFPEFGMDAIALQLGCLRLAPIQISSWGHPETSGLPTIDYYLSSDLMEPENGQDHYTETLVRLPNLSIYYTPLEIQADRKSKVDFGLKEDEFMFWCCQSLYKYLPQHDDIFPRIAEQLPNCKFVFIKYLGDASEQVTEVFSQRLNKAFNQLGLNYQDYCIFLPRLNTREFAGITALADVFLDSIGWSGCNSSLEAITYNLPIVTLPGELMRGRHTLAFLKMMGIEETIAASKEDYISIAVRLGQDPQYHQQISQKVAENKYKLYGDLQPVRALEDLMINLFSQSA
ncbi:MAG: tetratricopeptide repeat protein [Cyanobacteria bacterium J06592_8]